MAKAGFTSELVPAVALRAGETATIKVKLVGSGGRSDVTMYGTTQGVSADSQPYNVTAGTMTQLASARPINASSKNASGTAATRWCFGWRDSTSLITGTCSAAASRHTATPSSPAPTFGQFAGNATTTAIPAFANIDPPRMFQVQSGSCSEQRAVTSEP